MNKALVKFGLVGLLLATAGAVHAFHAYSVNHNYSIMPGGNIVPLVTGKYYLHSYVIETGPNCSNGDVWPLAQAPGHDLLGGDRFTGLAGFMENNMTPVVLEVVPLPSSGVPSYSQTIAASCPGLSNGAASVLFSVNPYGAGSAVTGVTQSSGFVDPQGANSGVYSVSAAEVVFQGGNQLLNGTIQWLPQVVDSITGGAVQGNGIPMPILDPIDYYVHDVNSGDLLASGTLLSIKVDQGPQPTSGGVVSVDSWGAQMRCYESSASIEIDQTSSLITQQGYLRIEMTNGVVSALTKTGIYASAAVSLNDPAPVSFALPAIQFDYDLGTFPGHDVEVTLVASGGGQSELGQITSACGGGFVCPPAPVPPYVDTYDSPVSLPQWTGQGIAADESGNLYLNDHSTVPAIYKGPPGGPFTTLTTQTTGGITNPPGSGGGAVVVDLGDMTWDASRGALWAGGLWQSGGTWVGHGDVYQVDPNTGDCRYRFTIGGFTDPVFGISWDRTDNSLWCAEYTGSSVRHVTSLGNPQVGSSMNIWDAGSTQVTGITGICATNFGLWVTGRQSDNEITLHDKSDGSYAGFTITTSCCELEGLECDPVTYPGCVLWCADLVYGNYTSYLIQDGSCATGWRLGDHCENAIVINSLPFFYSDSTVGLNDDYNELGNTSPDMVLVLDLPNTDSIVVSTCGSGFNTLLTLYDADSCQAAVLDTNADGGCVGTLQSRVVAKKLMEKKKIIVVDGAGVNDAGDFSLYIDYFYPFPAVCPYPQLDQEPINFYCGEGAVLECQDTICADIYPAGDFDWFKVLVPALPNCVRLTIDAFANSTPNYYPWMQGLNSYVELYDGCNNPVPLASAYEGGVGTDGRLITSCLDGGALGQYYYIKVQAQQSWNTGPYVLALSCESCICDTCLYLNCDTNSEPINDICDQDQCVFDCGDTLCGNMSPSGDVDWIWVVVPSSPSGCTNLRVDVFGDDTPSMYPYQKGLDPKLEIYLADCNSLFASASSGGVGNDPSAESCLTPDIYKIRVTGENNSSGPYIISFACNACVCYTDTTVFDLGGGNMDFTNFAEAVAHFDTTTIVGPQVVNVYSNTYNESVTFGPVAGASAANTIEFKKIVGALLTNPVVTWNGADVVTFDNADYYVWDGIDVAHLGVGAGSAIVMTNDADYNVVRNCALTNTQSGSTTYGVVMNSAANPSLTNDYNVFENLTISGFTDAVRLGNNVGIATSQTANEVRNCTISSCANGVVAGSQHDLRVRGNDISVSHPNHTTTYAVNIGQLNVDDTVRVQGNVIHDLTGTVAYGIYAATFQPNSMVWIYNNMISQWNAGICQSIVVRQHARAGVHFNSLYMNESPTATSYYGVGGGETANISISNNILFSDAVSDPVYAIAMGSAVTFTTDHNCFYGTGAQFYVGSFINNYQTLPDWQATGRDLNSIFAFPGYVSSSDLHIDGFYTACDALAVSIADISMDIDGQVRDPLTPDIGADEFQGLPGPVDDLVIMRIETTNDIQLTWSPLPGAMSYKIYRHTDPSTLAPIPAHYIGSTTIGSYVDVGVLAPPDQKYFYIIQASTLP